MILKPHDIINGPNATASVNNAWSTHHNILSQSGHLHVGSAQVMQGTSFPSPFPGFCMMERGSLKKVRMRKWKMGNGKCRNGKKTHCISQVFHVIRKSVFVNAFIKVCKLALMFAFYFDSLLASLNCELFILCSKLVQGVCLEALRDQLSHT